MQEMCYTGIVQRQPAYGTYLSSEGRGLFSEFAPSAFCFYHEEDIIMNKQELKIEYLPLSEIKPYEKNAKLHPDAQIKQIIKSINDFGFNDPIAIYHDNEIIEGHGRYLAAQKMGLDTVPVIRLDGLTEKQRKAYMLAHNKITMNSFFDLDLVSEELADIGEEFEMGDFGFDLNLIEDENPEKIEKEAKFDDSISVVVDCDDETQAEKIYNKLTEEGYVCRISTL